MNIRLVYPEIFAKESNSAIIVKDVDISIINVRNIDHVMIILGEIKIFVKQ